MEREAHRRRIPVSQLIRERLESEPSGTESTRTIPFAAIGRSGRRDTARNAEAILTDEWARRDSRARDR